MICVWSLGALGGTLVFSCWRLLADQHRIVDLIVATDEDEENVAS